MTDILRNRRKWNFEMLSKKQKSCTHTHKHRHKHTHKIQKRTKIKLRKWVSNKQLKTMVPISNYN